MATQRVPSTHLVVRRVNKRPFLKRPSFGISCGDPPKQSLGTRERKDLARQGRRLCRERASVPFRAAGYTCFTPPQRCVTEGAAYSFLRLIFCSIRSGFESQFLDKAVADRHKKESHQFNEHAAERRNRHRLRGCLIRYRFRRLIALCLMT